MALRRRSLLWVVGLMSSGVLGCSDVENPNAGGDQDTETGINPGISAGDTVTGSADDETAGGTSPTASGGTEPGEVDDCGQVTVMLEPVTPTIVLVVDQSGSMNEDFGGVQRWRAVYDTLMQPQTGVVATLQDDVRFGLTLYSSVDGNEGGMCPMLTAVSPALGNFEAIDAVYSAEVPIDETPTGESLELVVADLAAFTAEGPKAIVLATDGQPDTCAEPNPQNGQPESLAAAENAFDQDITTFIIAVGDEVGAEHLQDMANVGVGLEPDDPMSAPYYEALDAAELVAAFNEIIGSFISCELAIEGVVDLDSACEGTVSLDGATLTCGEDWEVPDPSTLRILGSACATLQDGGSHVVEASWPCGSVSIP